MSTARDSQQPVKVKMCLMVSTSVKSSPNITARPFIVVVVVVLLVVVVVLVIVVFFVFYYL